MTFATLWCDKLSAHFLAAELTERLSRLSLPSLHKGEEGRREVWLDCLVEEPGQTSINHLDLEVLCC